MILIHKQPPGYFLVCALKCCSFGLFGIPKNQQQLFGAPFLVKLTYSVPALDYNYLVDLVISDPIDSVSFRSIQPRFWWGNHSREKGVQNG
jgi:hypothetical protein